MSQIADMLPDEIAENSPRRAFGPGSIILLVGVVLVAAVFGIALLRQNQTQPESGPAPDFTLTTLDGGQLKLSALKGRVVVVNFWASWCVPCRDEAAVLETVWQEYKNKDVVFVGVAYTDTESGARSFLAEYNTTYPNGLDIGTKISELYNIEGVPETFIIDREGNVAKFFKMPFADSADPSYDGKRLLTNAIEDVLGNST